MLYRSAQATDILLPRWHQQRVPEVMLYRSARADGTSSVRLNLCCTAAPRLFIFSSLDGSGTACPKLFCAQACNQAGALGAIAPSIAPPSRLHPLALRFAPYIQGPAKVLT